MDMSSYGLNDDIGNIRSLDTMDLLSTSPPKQQIKAPSIFSPEWNEKPTSMAGNNGSGLLSNTDHGVNGSEMNALPSLSPRKDYEKRPISSDKKDKQMDQHHRSSEKSMKRDAMSLAASGMQYDASLPQNLLDTKSNKRAYNTELGQLDSIDYQQREMKIRKVEALSPLQNVPDLSKSAMSSKSFASINGIESKSMDSPNSDKYGKHGEFGKGSGNDVTITTDLVSTLLKESLSDTGNKFGAALDPAQKKAAAAAMQDRNAMSAYNMQPHQMMDARDQNQPQMIKSEDRAANQYSSQVPQYKQDVKRVQVAPVAAAMPRPVQSKADGQFNELLQSHQQPHQKMSQLQQEQSNVYGVNASLPPQLQIKHDSEQRTKSEKKKKKEKHKNKDKEKSKNREERKKHKKDKDRHKDKSKAHGHASSVLEPPKSPIRLKLNLSHSDHHTSATSHPLYEGVHNDGTLNATHPPPSDQLKLKISRDRIKDADVMDAKVQNAPLATAMTSTPTSLKIKIPKQVVADYNSGSVYNSQPMQSNAMGHSHNTSGGSGKKKDKNRDRDKSIRNSGNLSNPTKVTISV